MRNIWVISDTHFGHANIIKYCARPFANPVEQDDAIRTYWNETVDDGDIVYHLGDVYFGRTIGNNEEPEKFLKTLKGRKRLVLGNHDDLSDGVLQRVFPKVTVWRNFGEFGKLLTHVPVHYNSLSEVPDRKPLLNIHGHIHDKPAAGAAYVNVCVEWTNYRPVNLDEIMAP